MSSITFHKEMAYIIKMIDKRYFLTKDPVPSPYYVVVRSKANLAGGSSLYSPYALGADIKLEEQLLNVFKV